MILEKGRAWTRNLRPGVRVYGERVRRMEGHEFRDWSARRSKLAAYLARGGRAFETKGTEHVLYLGAASGTTVSHLSDLLPNGRIVAVEFSPRPFRELLHLAAQRENIVPVLSDARRPESYAPYLERTPDLIVQDIAQRDQADILVRNVRRFAAPSTRTFFAIKSRSVNVAAQPRKVYESVRRELEEAGLKVREVLELEPYEKDHAVLVFDGR